MIVGLTLRVTEYRPKLNIVAGGMIDNVFIFYATLPAFYFLPLCE